MTSLLHGTPRSDTKQEWARLHKFLTGRLTTFSERPGGRHNHL
jgi:hypothetical protein